VERAPASHFLAAKQPLAFAEALLLSVWLGSMIFFSFAVAPSAFAVLQTREMAGALVTSTINKVELLGLIVGPLLILINAASWRFKHLGSVAKSTQIIFLAAMIAAAALSHFWITPTMVSLRGAMGGHIDDVPISDPLRMRFNDLHHYSVALMGTAMIAGFVVLLLTVRSWIRR
jgi:hypothetical protein